LRRNRQHQIRIVLRFDRDDGVVTDRFGIAPDEVAFVSSNRWDIMGAASFGFRAVWVNRAQAPQEYPHQLPAHTVSDLSALPSLEL